MASAAGKDWSDTDINVLYDIFFETGTRLSGEYLDLLRRARSVGDDEMAAFWDGEVLRVDEERRAVNSNNRHEIADTMSSFRHELTLVQATRRTLGDRP